MAVGRDVPDAFDAGWQRRAGFVGFGEGDCGTAEGGEGGRWVCVFFLRVGGFGVWRCGVWGVEGGGLGGVADGVLAGDGAAVGEAGGDVVGEVADDGGEDGSARFVYAAHDG